MRNIRVPFRFGRTLRGVIAVGFLAVLLIEWGSHSLAFTHSESPKGQMTLAVESDSKSDHDDPCKTMVRCPDGRQDQQGGRYDGSQHNQFLGDLLAFHALSQVQKSPPPERERASLLFRPVIPPFHPPESSPV